jgi:cytochrome c5
MKRLGYAAILALAVSLTWMAVAATGDGRNNDKDKDGATASTSVATPSSTQDDHIRVEGEKRFHANCGRCHAAPPKIAPRMMGTIIRHMRVRATITDEDMRFILRYMTQ